MDQKTTVWLLRHGEAAGMAGRCCGRFDAPLSLEGTGQAKRAAAQLVREPISRMYSSYLERAFKTAQIVAEPHGLEVERVDDLAEMHFGDLEGLTYEEAEKRFPDVYRSWMTRPMETQFPNGENFQQMRTRVLRAFDSIVRRHPGETIGIVAHAGVNRIVLCKEMSIPEDEMFQIAQPHCAINRLG
jgi:alpha-ribazole phosphatase/probable phosphoglycerate mutase